MNIKRFLMAAAALFIYINAFEWLVHGVLLVPLYNETPTIWREYTQMMAHAPYNIAIVAGIAIWLTFVFTRLFKEGGWKNGLTLGIYFGVFSGMQAAGAYYYLPVSLTLAGYWFIASVIESIIGGVIIGSIYRSSVPR